MTFGTKGMGRRAKTIDNCFCEAETAQSNEPTESSLAQTIGGDYATVEGDEKSHLRNQKEKSRKRLFLFVLFTLLFSLFTFL